MKLVIFTPVLQASAIGRMARLVVKALCGMGHGVTVVRTELAECSSGEVLDFGVPVLNWADDSAVRGASANADSLVYQIGDNFAYHAGGVGWLERLSGIVCMHDFFLGHLFCGWARSDTQRATAVLERCYGDEAARTFFRHASSPQFIDATHQTAPMTEWIAQQARAVISHSGWGMDRVLTACQGPVRVVPLAYEAPLVAEVVSQHSERLQVLTVGHVNPNKRAEQVIRALGADKRLRGATSYTLAGAVQPEMRRRLEALAQTLGVDLSVRGEVTGAELGRLLSQADVVCCLRKPTLESASASTIEAMLSGCTVVVEDVGFYAELPDEYVRKIRPEHEEEDLRKVLLTLVNERRDGKQRNERAAAWARQTFSAENYAHQLVELVQASQKAMRVSETMQAYASLLNRWGENESLLTLLPTLEPLKIFEVSPVAEQH